ncbi:MAG: HTTM domain-containing protein [Polyangiales bacterium]
MSATASKTVDTSSSGVGVAARLLARWNGIFDEPRSLRAIGLLRVLVGPIVLLHLVPFLQDMAAGHAYADGFYSPWFASFPEAPRSVYFALLVGAVPAALLLTLGLFTRFAKAYCWAFVTWNYFLCQTHFHNNRTFLVVVLSVLLLLPCGNVLSLDAWRARRRGAPLPTEAPLWAMYLLRFEALSVYLGSGGSKLFEPDWRAGIVTWDRVLRYRHLLEASIAPEWLVELLSGLAFHAVFAKVAIATEIFVAVGLVFRRTRYAAAFVAFWFHAVIGVALKVEVFSYLAVAVLLVWSTPKVRDRRLEIDEGDPRGRALARRVRRLDWLARFEIVGGDGPPRLVERDGSEHVGGAAVARAYLRMPLLFPFVAPLALPGVRRWVVARLDRRRNA